MRGEYVCPKSQKRRSMELPPHARRIPSPLCFALSPPGTTSACAENTSVRNPRNGGQWNYLRMRGEYDSVSMSFWLSWELPPHARRIPWGASHGFHRGGTTSACAENTTGSTCTNTFGGNYLRMRGEYPPCFIIIFAFMELPPHARRIPPPAPPKPGKQGTTSACAENTGVCIRWGVFVGNYLRMRGEYVSQRRRPV